MTDSTPTIPVPVTVPSFPMSIESFFTGLAYASLVSMKRKGIDIDDMMEISNVLGKRATKEGQYDFKTVNMITVAMAAGITPLHTVRMALDDDSIWGILKDDINSRNLRDLVKELFR